MACKCQSREKEKILTVGDEKDVIELLQYNLEKEGYVVNCAFSGEQSLAYIKFEIPDLILLDLMLPEINGIEICKILKKNSTTSKIPIIMLTSKEEDIDIILGLELGVDDYITKPFNLRELLTRAKAILRRIKNNNSLIFKEKEIINFDVNANR